ncbi:serine/threonine protein phosphatase-like protein [Dermatophagoides farinae]|nr:serine/threonine protein phosphatase-like protein [Dermatophagoides farinae]
MDIKNLMKLQTNNVCDNHCFIIICQQHGGGAAGNIGGHIMLRRTNVFFPCLPLNPLKTWSESSIEAALSLLLPSNIYNDHERLMEFVNDIPFRRFVCMDIFRIQLPHTQNFITRLIYLVELDPTNKNIVCGCLSQPQSIISSNNYRWYPINDAISRKIKKIWGPEVSFYTNIAIEALNSNQPFVDSTATEYSLSDAFKYVPRESPITMEEQMLGQTNITVNDIERLYADFIEHCFPSFFFTKFSFDMYMKKHQIESNPSIISRYYLAFRFREKQYMQFHELLLGLAAIDHRSPHEEFRIRFIFRFYDHNQDRYLNYQEFERLIHDLEMITATEIKSPSSSLSMNQTQIRLLMKKIGTVIVNQEEMINFDSFRHAIQKCLLLGTNQLCRSSVSPFGQITRSLATRKLCTTVSNKNLYNICLNRRYKNPCENCKRKQYDLSSDVIVLDYRGHLKSIHRIVDYSKKTSMKKTSPTEKAFDQNSLMYFILQKIREFNKEKNQPHNLRKGEIGLFNNLNRKETQTFCDDFRIICSEVAKIFEREDRVLKICDPCYVIGDIHGNLEDLLTLEQCLWKSFPLLTSNYLFLGDYVDRGRWGFECFYYLLIAKYLCPKKIFLIRGNHEIECIQMKYSFHKELLRKYGQHMGQQFFELINEVFNRLPFAAIINDSIYCAHGGLPYTEQNLAVLNREMPKVIRDPENEAIPVWELVWSDPLEFAKFGEQAELLGLPPAYMNGFFLPNIKRGTSFFFNEYAVIAFFKENNLNYMIRAHEVPAPGYKFNFGTLCTTIFSCSHYCGNNNECAVVFIDRDSRIRIVRIDTSMNQSAT